MDLMDTSQAPFTEVCVYMSLFLELCNSDFVTGGKGTKEKPALAEFPSFPPSLSQTTQPYPREPHRLTQLYLRTGHPYVDTLHRTHPTATLPPTNTQ